MTLHRLPAPIRVFAASYLRRQARWAIAWWLGIGSVACAPSRPAPAVVSQVHSGQLYQSGQSEFDAVFRELHELRLMLDAAPDEERQIRKDLAAALGSEDGATRQRLADQVTTRTVELGKNKIRIRLEIEGLEADDDADTMAQAKVLGALDESAQQLVEATTRAARLELRLMAHLRRAQKRVEHLARHAAALDPWIDNTFGSQGDHKIAEVHRNLDDARRQFPLLSVRASELADETRRTAQRLASAMTNDSTLGSAKDLPLIAPAQDPPPAKVRARPAASSPGAKRPSGTPSGASKPAPSAGTDFEP